MGAVLSHQDTDCKMYSVAERLRLEAEEQARRAAEEEKRQILIQEQTRLEDLRLAAERYEQQNARLQSVSCSCMEHFARNI